VPGPFAAPVRAPAPLDSVPVPSSLASVPAAAHRTSSQSGIRKPKVYHDGTDRYGNLTISEEPNDLTTAMSDPN
jgi:hypothetical protein